MTKKEDNSRDEVLLRMLKTPPTPHAKMKVKRKPKPSREGVEKDKRALDAPDKSQ